MGGDVFRDEYSLAFDGSNEYIAFGDITTYDGLDDLTIAVWMKLDASASGNNRIFCKGSYNADGASFAVRYGVTSGRLNFSVERDENQADGEGIYAHKSSLNDSILGKWCHLVIVYSNTNDSINFYLNGVDVGLDGGMPVGTYISIPNSTEKLEIGSSGSNDFHGNMSEVATYNTALSASQVKTIYNGREPFNHKDWAKTSNLNAWWRMGDDQGNLAITNGSTQDGGTGVIADQLNKKSAVIKEWDFSSGVDGWEAYSGNSVSQSTAITNHLGGVGVLKCENNDTSEQWMGRSDTVSDGTYGIELNKLYLIEYYIYVPSSWSGTCKFRCQEASMAGKNYVMDIIRPTSATKDSWQYGKSIFSPGDPTDLSGHLYPQTVSDDSLVADDFVYISGVKLTEYESTNHGAMANHDIGSIEGDTP